MLRRRDELDRLVQPERVRVPYGAERVAVDDSETMIGADCEKRNDEKSEEPHGTDRCMGEWISYGEVHGKLAWSLFFVWRFGFERAINYIWAQKIMGSASVINWIWTQLCSCSFTLAIKNVWCIIDAMLFSENKRFVVQLLTHV